MSERASDWNRLDNAAKIFPPTSNKQDTKVFRFACQLNERVEQEILQQATEKTLETFPIFRSVLKHGLFWYYRKNRPCAGGGAGVPPCLRSFVRPCQPQPAV